MPLKMSLQLVLLATYEGYPTGRALFALLAYKFHDIDDEI